MSSQKGDNDEDEVKLALLYYLHHRLLCANNWKTISIDVLELIDDFLIFGKPHELF